MQGETGKGEVLWMGIRLEGGEDFGLSNSSPLLLSGVLNFKAMEVVLLRGT
jgi:hypothetical protein